ncbi:MAG: S41 family peptidase [Gemmatimonadaceae bacterium]|nr:S41 family peptidase [Gemmatimonadaceae bacterium]
MSTRLRLLARRATILVATALTVALVTGGVRTAARTRGGAQLLDQVLSLVALRHVDARAADSLYEAAARGLVRELGDPYSELLTPADRAAFLRSTAGRYSGVGMLLTPPVDGFVMVDKVYPNTPAAARGVREGDRLTAIDGIPIRNWSVDRVQAKLLGETGTAVQVQFQRAGVTAPITHRFARAEVHVSSVPFAMMLGDGVGYVPVTQFGEQTAADVARAVQSLQRQGANGLVLDLRGNPGGIVGEAFSLANLFLPAGEVLLTVKQRTGDEVLRAEQAPLAPSMPLAVLVDGGSASASEIVAGALQDYDRALVLGTTSYGKGLVQSVFELDGGYALKLTTGRWFTPSGRSIQKPRRFDGNGRYVEITPDSLETPAARRARPTFASRGGRTLYGGGAITPDVILSADTITTAEQRLRQALAPHYGKYFAALTAVAEQQRGVVRSDFAVQPAWRAAVLTRLAKDSVTLDPALVQAGASEIDRALEERIGRLVFGDSTVLRHQLRYDTQLSTAHALVRGKATQMAVFDAASGRGGADHG